MTRRNKLSKNQKLDLLSSGIRLLAAILYLIKH